MYCLLIFIIGSVMRTSLVDFKFRPAYRLEPCVEIHQARMLLAQCGNIGRVADLVEIIKRASDLCILLLKGPDRNLHVADGASYRTADGSGYLSRRQRISGD